jgi:hypothetical protein
VREGRGEREREEGRDKGKERYGGERWGEIDGNMD